jgi:hypothetical protein
VTVREVAEDADHPALRFQHDDPNHPGWTHAQRIETHTTRLNERVGDVVGVQALKAPIGFIITDGAHRALAYYMNVNAQPRWRLTAQVVRVVPPPPA